MEKRLFESTGGFVEDLRMAEDLEWLKRLRRSESNLSRLQPLSSNMTVFLNHYWPHVQKYFKSGYYTSFVLENFKNLLFSALLLAAILIIPRWNFFLDGWDSNPLFIPNVTKIVFLIVISLLLIWRVIYFLLPRGLPDNLFVSTVKLSVLIMTTWSVYNWNKFWVDYLSSKYYIFHISQKYMLD